MRYEGNEDIRQRTFNFSIRVITLCRSLPKDEVNRILMRQVIRSATSIGANLEEASGARTRPEFANCTNIARKEARETYYWLKIIHEVNTELIKKRMRYLLDETDQIISILTSTMKKLQTTS